jgi:aminoglycoside phosphotransferase (APT) family kinase protein
MSSGPAGPPERDPAEPAHGFALDPAEHRLLRGRPPAAALRWCAAAAGGRGAAVVRVEALGGGTSSAVHAVDVRDRRGRVQALVLRRFVRADWLLEEPDLARHEAAALELAGASGLPVPRLVAVDHDGAREPRHHHGGHAVTVAGPPVTAIPDYAPYRLRLTAPPSWTRRSAVWERAMAAFGRYAPAPGAEGERVLIHRDYHPGNVLWAAGVVTGVVDWVNASRGSPDADVGHCRMNLAGALGADAADRFLALHRAASGRGDYDPLWDIAAALGGFDDTDVARWSRADEDFLAQAVARL